MKYGVRLPHFRHIAADVQRVGQSIRTVAKAAEDLGFHSVWVADHVVVPADPTSKYGSVWTEALTTLSFAAGCTDRVRLGTSILVAPYRHPLLAAKMLASLDALSAGRLDLGLAVGHLESGVRGARLGHLCQTRPDNRRVHPGDEDAVVR